MTGKVKIRFEPNLVIFLALLLGADALYLILHGLWFYHNQPFLYDFIAFFGKPEFFANPAYAIDKDLGYAEAYQYLKYCWAAGLMIWLFGRDRQWVYLFWSMFLIYFLLDDAGSLHEKLGGWITRHFEYISVLGLRDQDFGELTFTALVGSAFLAFGIIAYKHSAEYAQRSSMILVGLTILLAFFGVVFDMIQIMSTSIFSSSNFSFLLGTIEDGGEMLTMSIICWYAYLLSVAPRTFVEDFNVRMNIFDALASRFARSPRKAGAATDLVDPNIPVSS